MLPVLIPIYVIDVDATRAEGKSDLSWRARVQAMLASSWSADSQPDEIPTPNSTSRWGKAVAEASTLTHGTTERLDEHVGESAREADRHPSHKGLDELVRESFEVLGLPVIAATVGSAGIKARLQGGVRESAPKPRASARQTRQAASKQTRLRPVRQHAWPPTPDRLCRAGLQEMVQPEEC